MFGRIGKELCMMNCGETIGLGLCCQQLTRLQQVIEKKMDQI